MHHIMMDLYVVHPMYNLRIFDTLIIRPNMNLGMVACGLFVMISGATLSINNREEGLVSFYKKRLTRVLIPFYIAYLIYFAIKVLTFKTIFLFNNVPKWRFVFTLFGIDEYLSANGIRTFSLGVGEWFLGCIILCYFAYPILAKLHKLNKYVTFAVMTAYFVFINLNYNKFGFVIPSYMNFLCQIYNFYLGIVLIDENILSKLKKYLLIICIPIILFFYFYKNTIFIPDNFKTTITLLPIFICFYNIENIITTSEFVKKSIMYFNKISFEVFLVHHFVIYQVDYMLGYKRLRGYEAAFVILFDLAMTIILAIIVEKLSSKVYRFMKKS